MKNVCIITWDMSQKGGVEQVASVLSGALTAYYHVHFISINLCHGEMKYTLDNRISFTSLFNEDARLRDIRKKAKALLCRYFKENQIDTALILGNYPGFVVSACRFHTKTKLVFCDHGALMNEWEKKDIVIIRLLSSLLCHKIVTLTEQNRQDYIRHFKINKRKITAIPNWIDSAVPHSEHYDINSRKIISAGRFGREKGFDRLIDAFSAVYKKHPDWRLDLYGDGETMPLVKRNIEKYRLENGVRLMGMRNDLAEHYGEYAMYVLPSYREGLPLVLLEAKLNRLPIVSFDIMTGPKEIVRDGIDGLLVPANDVDALSNAMSRLIENENLRKEMSDKTQENISRFAKESIIKQWCELIEQKGWLI